MSSASSSALALQRFREAAALHQGGQLERAAALYGAIVRDQPGHADALHMLGLIALQQGRSDEGIRLIRDSLRRNPQQPMAHANLARAHIAAGQPAAAVASLERALRLAPGFADGWLLRASLLADLDHVEGALADYDRALALQPGNAAALNNRGNLRMRQHHPEHALADYDLAIALQPDFAEAHNNRSGALLDLKRPQEALASADRALALQPDFAAAHNSRGNALRMLRHSRDAIASFEQALALQPRFADALSNLCGALFRLRRHAEAMPLYERLLAIDPAYPDALGNLYQAELHCCAWDHHDERLRQIRQAVGASLAASQPGTMLSVPCEPTLQLQCAARYVARKFPAPPRLTDAGSLRRRGRIRIAYASADYGEHPVAQLAAGFLASHDHARFEVHGIALGPTDPAHPMHRKLRACFDAFHDVAELDDGDAARQLAALGIDILIDLNGHTLGARPGLFAHRPAPLQATFLGYAGTTGAPWFDYLIADAVVVPPGEAGYTECILSLPGCFLPRDDRQAVPAGPSRHDEGLPEDGFVFCGFNATYKLNPVMFDIWMRLLQGVPGSVLWLRHPAEPAASNLRREAAARGVAPERLVYARRVDDHGEHLARHRLADLFLDTQPYNAHTTASDALFTGLPVLTCRGTAFAGRVAESLLRAAGLPELVAADLEHYERLALQLANDPPRLRNLREHLGEGRSVQPWFDTHRYTRQLEAGFEAMRARALAGEAPADIVVPSL